ncbi:MAG: hypothetical protein WDA47_04670 [Bacilli bacterium]
MKQEINLLLERPARKSGADRYITTNLGVDNFTVYIPQKFSRKLGEPKETGKITLEME